MLSGAEICVEKDVQELIRGLYVDENGLSKADFEQIPSECLADLKIDPKTLNRGKEDCGKGSCFSRKLIIKRWRWFTENPNAQSGASYRRFRDGYTRDRLEKKRPLANLFNLTFPTGPIERLINKTLEQVVHGAERLEDFKNAFENQKKFRSLSFIFQNIFIILLFIELKDPPPKN